MWSAVVCLCLDCVLCVFLSVMLCIVCIVYSAMGDDCMNILTSLFGLWHVFVVKGGWEMREGNDLCDINVSSQIA